MLMMVRAATQACASGASTVRPNARNVIGAGITLRIVSQRETTATEAGPLVKKRGRSQERKKANRQD